MPLSNLDYGQINTIPLASVAGAINYTFKMKNESETAQVLWIHLTWTGSATPGAKRPILQFRNPAGSTILQVAYFSTVAASATALVQWVQGNTVIPPSVAGLQTGIPTNGIFMQNNFSISIFPFPVPALPATMTGFMQTRGLHNSAAP